MTTDNRTNEPTEAQVEAADAAFVEAFQIPQDGTTVYEVRKRAMRAALVAAQGAAPVLPSSTVDEDALAESPRMWLFRAFGFMNITVRDYREVEV